MDLPREMGRLEVRFIDSDDFGRIMALEGAIAPGDAARFDRALAGADPKPAFVSLHSPGGSLTDALAIGKAVPVVQRDDRTPDAYRPTDEQLDRYHERLSALAR